MEDKAPDFSLDRIPWLIWIWLFYYGLTESYTLVQVTELAPLQGASASAKDVLLATIMVCICTVSTLRTPIWVAQRIPYGGWATLRIVLAYLGVTYGWALAAEGAPGALIYPMVAVCLAFFVYYAPTQAHRKAYLEKKER